MVGKQPFTCSNTSILACQVASSSVFCMAALSASPGGIHYTKWHCCFRIWEQRSKLDPLASGEFAGKEDQVLWNLDSSSVTRKGLKLWMTVVRMKSFTGFISMNVPQGHFLSPVLFQVEPCRIQSTPLEWHWVTTLSVTKPISLSGQKLLENRSRACPKPGFLRTRTVSLQQSGKTGEDPQHPDVHGTQGPVLNL